MIIRVYQIFYKIIENIRRKFFYSLLIFFPEFSKDISFNLENCSIKEFIESNVLRSNESTRICNFSLSRSSIAIEHSF